MKSTEKNVLHRQWTLGALTLFVVGMSVTCAGNHTGRHAALRQALGPARALWESRVSEMAGYDLTVGIGCFCPQVGEYVLQVRNGVLEAIQPRRPDQWSDVRVKAIVEAYTVDGLFGTIDQALASNAEVVEPVFDVHYGYPIAIKVDHHKAAFDDELQIAASLLTVPREAEH